MQRIVDMRVPLPWLMSSSAALIACLISVVWQLAGATARIETLSGTVNEMHTQLQQRDDRIERLALEVQATRSINEVQNQRISAAEENIRALRAAQQ